MMQPQTIHSFHWRLSVQGRISRFSASCRFLLTLLCLLIFLTPSLARAQGTPWDDPPSTAPAQQTHALTFSDLQHSMHDYNTGKGDNGFRNGILCILAIISFIALVIHLRQRHISAGPPDSIHRLGRELARAGRHASVPADAESAAAALTGNQGDAAAIFSGQHSVGGIDGELRFPFASRRLLKWVAHSTKTPFASLLLSSALFDRCVIEWTNHPTFSVARHWGKARLDCLRAVLFD